jgi:hypothetical protein
MSTMNIDELAAKVIQAIQDDPDAVRAVSAALASGDARHIRHTIQKHAGIQLTMEEAQQISDHIQAEPRGAAAYFT